MPRTTTPKKAAKRPVPTKRAKAPAKVKEMPKVKRKITPRVIPEPVPEVAKEEVSLEEVLIEDETNEYPRRHITAWQMVAAIVGAASLVAGLIVMVKPDAFRKAAVPTVDRGTVAQLSNRQEFMSWVKGWAGVNEYLKIGEFQLATSLPITTATVAGADAIANFQQPRGARLLVSPDGAQAADLFAEFGSADARVLVARSGGQFEELTQRARPGYFQGGLWMEDDVLVAMGTAAERRDSGEPLCIAVAGGAPACLYRLTLDVFDFTAMRHDTYFSEKHGLPTDPFREALRQRWESSLTPDERLEAGLTDVGATTETVEGEVVSLAVNGFVMKTSSEMAADREVIIHGQTVVADERMDAVGAAFLRPAMKVGVTGYRDSTGRLIATQVAVLDGPMLSVAGVPEDAIFPKEGLTLKGEVRQGAKSLTVKLKSRRTGAVLASIEVVFSASNDPWQNFELHLAPEAALRAGEPLTLAVFDPANLEVGETFRLTAARP